MLSFLRGIFAKQLNVIDELLISFWLLNLVIVMSITKYCFGLVYIHVASMSLALKLKWIHICKWAWNISWWFILVYSKISLHFLSIKYNSQGRVEGIFPVGVGEAISLINLMLKIVFLEYDVLAYRIFSILSLHLAAMLFSTGGLFAISNSIKWLSPMLSSLAMTLSWGKTASKKGTLCQKHTPGFP